MMSVHDFTKAFDFSGYVLALSIASALTNCRMIGMHDIECIGNRIGNL